MSYRIESSVTFETPEQTLKAYKGLKLEDSEKNQVRIVKITKTQVDEGEPTYDEKETTVDEIERELRGAVDEGQEPATQPETVEEAAEEQAEESPKEAN